VVDRVVAAVLLALVSPVVAALGALVRRHDGGPALITVDRVGRGGRPFRMWKIRSMRVADDRGRAGGASLTGSTDDRITPIGRRLRALHLDELPQLWNVARGEMCLLGPRPEAPPFVDLEDPAWRSVLQAPPGIAGPTQLVVGDWELARIDADVDGSAYRRVVLPVKLAIDGWYVRRCSPALDLRVLVALVRRVLTSTDDARLFDLVRTQVPDAAEAVDADGA
jgi:lipopolysaccharide/colanic/teichoic acid biosynthesis glycosyltransferase